MTAITAPSAAHPHLPDQACGHLCQAPAPAAVVVARQTAPPQLAARRARHPWILIGASALGSIALGIFLIVWGATNTHPVYAYTSMQTEPIYADIAWGVFFILAPFLIAIIAAIVTSVRVAAEAHRQWLSQFTPEQQKRIRQAEQAAVAVGAYALHRHMRRVHRETSARLSASVTGDQPWQQYQPGMGVPPELQQSRQPVDWMTASSLELMARSNYQQGRPGAW